MSRGELSPEQRAQAHAHGLTDDDLSRQLVFYASPPPPTRLVRPCTAGDGIRVLDSSSAERLAARYAETLDDRVPVAFVPASGAGVARTKIVLGS